MTLIIAADGGAVHCLALGITPDVVVGDFDSLSPDQLNRLKASGTDIIRHPVRKDDTDLELALKTAVDRGADENPYFRGTGQPLGHDHRQYLHARSPHLVPVPGPHHPRFSGNHAFTRNDRPPHLWPKRRYPVSDTPFRRRSGHYLRRPRISVIR